MTRTTNEQIGQACDPSSLFDIKNQSDDVASGFGQSQSYAEERHLSFEAKDDLVYKVSC